MAKQLLGKEVTAALNEKIKANVAELQAKGVDPTLCIIRVGENPSDISYERGATKRCETLGVACEKILLPEDVSQNELLATIDSRQAANGTTRRPFLTADAPRINSTASSKATVTPPTSDKK